MNKLVSICFFLILSFVTFAQTQQEGLYSLTAKGKSNIGFDLGMDVRASVNPNTGTSIGFKFRPALTYQYNVLDRLSIGGSISNITRLNYFDFSTKSQLRNLKSIGGSVFVRYYPFKRNGFFVEGEYIHEFLFIPDTKAQHLQKFAVNPGYTFMIGKNKNIALDLKMRITYQPNPNDFLSGLIPIPTFGLKVPIGK